jgi:DNA helicase-2/ATP-dependent DNA helicase PcrA
MFIADLHIHSKYSRATSRELCFEQLYAWGRRKGVALVGTGDCTHPGWRAEIREKLEPTGDGLLRLKDAPASPEVAPAWDDDVSFLLTGEISTIYKAGGATRKVHHVVCLPNLDAADRFAGRLERIGNIASDGRPILGLDSRDLLETLLETSPDAVLIPAHIWTPWFSVLGSKSGFDGIEECYRDLSPYIFALETGLSSDPAMNWTVSSLDRYTLVSNSDAHSPAKLGREANVFDCAMGYTAVMDALKRQAPGFRGTLEFFPEEGKYHYDGHRKCNFTCLPEESKALGGRCPSCGSLLTLGVEYRVTELADRPRGTKPAGAEGFTSLLSLAEILGELNETAGTTKKVGLLYDKLLAEVGPELYILMGADREQISAAGGEFLTRAIEKIRSGKIHATPGYDGEYGVIRVFDKEERAEVLGQIQMFEGVSLAGPAKKRPARAVEVVAEAAPAYVVEHGMSAEQQQAVEHRQGPLVILAGPGAGKTRTLVERIARLIEEENADPDSILALTFSNRAARELAERLDARLAEGGKPTAGTFHKIGFRLIAEHRERLSLPEPLKILSEEEAESLFAETRPLRFEGEPGNIDELERTLAELYAGATDDPEELRELAKQARELAPHYLAAKRERGALDFTDLLLLPLELLAGDEDMRTACRERWRHVFVDEYQDVNVFQYLLLRLLCPPGSDLCVIGDPDQAIYGFRGADVRYFLRFREDYPGAGQISLTRNYRSSSTIVRAGAELITRGGLPSERTLWSDRPGAECIEVAAMPTPGTEAEYVVQTVEGLLGGISHFSVDSGRGGEGATELGFSDIAVLYRTHALGEEVQAAFERSGIPYQRAARRDIIRHPEIRRVLAQARDMEGDLPAIRALLEACLTLGIAEDALRQHPWPAMLDRAREAEGLTAFRHGLSLDRDIDIYDPRAARVALMTAHAAKGLEWEVVFVVGCEEGSFPHPAAPADEERRLFYVAMTRAKTRLYLTHAATRARRGEREPRRPSPFLRDIPSELRCNTAPARPAKPRDTQLELFGE